MHPFKLLWDEHLGFDNSDAIEYRDNFYNNVSDTLHAMIYKMKKRAVIEIPNNLFKPNETVYEEKILHSNWMEIINNQMQKTQEELDIDEESSRQPYYIRDYARGYIIYSFYSPEEKFAIDIRNQTGLWEMVGIARSYGVSKDIANGLYEQYSKFTPVRVRVQDEICLEIDAKTI